MIKEGEDLGKPTVDLVNAVRAVVKRDLDLGLVSPERMRWTIEARQQVTKELSDKGMTTRQIADVTGVAQTTVIRDLQSTDTPKVRSKTVQTPNQNGSPSKSAERPLTGLKRVAKEQGWEVARPAPGADRFGRISVAIRGMLDEDSWVIKTLNTIDEELGASSADRDTAIVGIVIQELDELASRASAVADKLRTPKRPNLSVASSGTSDGSNGKGANAPDH